MSATRPLHVVPHTHWDREWYRPFENYRFRLVKTIDGLLESDLPYFLMDGQTVVLDDYLAIRPEAEARIREWVAAGRLGVGPWYVLVDEFLVSGEALVRNLLVGRSRMRELGATGAVGYLPDMFGHIAQMPQILKGFGLDTAVVWRGAAPGAPRFVWRGPDGSEVVAAWLPMGYYQTMFVTELPPAKRRELTEAYVAAFDGAESAWLLSGADHMAPRADLESQLAGLAISGVTPRIATLGDAVAGPRPAAVLEGELRTPLKLAYVLPGVLSTRTYLKVANARCQTLLERYAEPLAALAALGGAPHPGAFMAHAWRELMKNHPHDSICGCSVDQVHREMLPRFAAARQVAGEVIGAAVRAHARPQAAPALYAFNPTGWAADTWVDATVHWPLEGAPAAIHLVDAAGLAVPTVLHEADDTEVFRAEVDFNPDWFPVRRFRLSAELGLPGLGGGVYRAVAGAPAAVAAGVAAGDGAIENDLVRLYRDGDGLTLVDKRSGRAFPACHAFVDEADAGDTYNFSPLEGDRPTASILTDVAAEAEGPHAATLVARYELVLPVGLSADRKARAAETHRLVVTSRFRLKAGSPLLTVETTFENAVRDHRLRLVTAAAGAREAWSEGKFGVFPRTPLPAPALPVARGTEAPMPEFPQEGFTALHGEGGGLLVACEGLHEAALAETPGGLALSTTLVRAVGWLSRDDLRTRGGGAGPRFETPEAQCPGPQAFRYALAPYAGPWRAALPLAHAFAAPPLVLEADGPGTPETGVLTLGDPGVVVSALKRSEDGRTTVVRVYNPTPEAMRGTFDWKLPHAGVFEADLAETPGAPQGRGPFAYALRPYEVRTWLVEA